MKLLTAEEVAAMLQVKPSWVYAAARRGDVPAVPLPGGRYVRFDEVAIRDWIASLDAGRRRAA
jgi:excisionase family DNA binding protein